MFDSPFLAVSSTDTFIDHHQLATLVVPSVQAQPCVCVHNSAGHLQQTYTQTSDIHPNNKEQSLNINENMLRCNIQSQAQQVRSGFVIQNKSLYAINYVFLCLPRKMLPRKIFKHAQCRAAEDRSRHKRYRKIQYQGPYGCPKWNFLFPTFQLGKNTLN